MYELIQLGEKTYYIDCPAKMGLYQISESEVCLIDSGNDKDAGKKLLKILESRNWTLKMILNTHSHADHIGGNQFLQQRSGCKIYAPGADAAFTQFPFLEPSFLSGGYPCRELRNKFLNAQPSGVQELTEAILPQGLQLLRIDGHSFAMAAIKTDDDVWFLADCLTSEAIIEKYHIPFLYDVAGYLESLQRVRALEGRLFLPAHAAPTADIRPLVERNLEQVAELLALLTELCAAPRSFDDILKAVFDHYALVLDWNQSVLVGSTLRSYLAYLHDGGKMNVLFSENRLLWQSTPT